MKFWYFKFDGVFEDGSANAGDGVFSGCMIPEDDFQKARSKFLNALKEEKIAISETIEYFSLDGESLDPSDPLNEFWSDWYRKTADLNEPCFDVLHLYRR